MKLPHDLQLNKLNNALLPGLQSPAVDGPAAQSKRGFADNLRSQISMIAETSRQGSGEPQRRTGAKPVLSADRGTDLPVAKQKLPSERERASSERTERQQLQKSQQPQKHRSADSTANDQVSKNSADSARGPGRAVVAAQRVAGANDQVDTHEHEAGGQRAATQDSPLSTTANSVTDNPAHNSTATDHEQSVGSVETTQAPDTAAVFAETQPARDLRDPLGQVLLSADAELLAKAAVSGSDGSGLASGGSVSAPLVSLLTASTGIRDSVTADLTTGTGAAGLAVSTNTTHSHGQVLNGLNPGGAAQNAQELAPFALFAATPGTLTGTSAPSDVQHWLSLPVTSAQNSLAQQAASADSSTMLAFSALAPASGKSQNNTGPEVLFSAHESAADLAGIEFTLADKLFSQKPVAAGSLQYASLLFSGAAPSGAATETPVSGMLLSGLSSGQQGSGAGLDTQALPALTASGNGGSSSQATASGLATSVYGQDQRQQAAAEARAQVQNTRGVDTSLTSTSALKLPGLDVAFGQAGWADRIGRQMLLQSAQGSSSAQIRLDPPELGSLTVKIQLVDQSAAVNFVSPHAMVRDALEQQAGRLQEMFREQGMNLVDVSVSDQSAQSDTGTQQQSQGSATGPATWLADDDSPAAPAVRQSESLIDYYA